MAKSVANFSDLLGITLSNVRVIKDTEIIFETPSEIFQMVHEQECCEDVHIESIVGDIQHLIGYPILLAEMVVDVHESWTFYKLATRKGYVDIRWISDSNGYYSESVDFFSSKIPIPNENGDSIYNDDCDCELFCTNFAFMTLKGFRRTQNSDRAGREALTVGYIGLRPAIWKGNFSPPKIGEKFQICQDGFELPFIVGGGIALQDGKWEVKGKMHYFSDPVDY